jgi:cation:H+ antiporter
MTAVLLVCGLIFLLIGGEALVRGAVALGLRLRLSPLFVGMVIAGFGTSMPELVVSVRATIAGSPSIAVGNVIGSNISNVLLILGVAALVRPIGRPPRLFVPDGLVLLGVSAGVVLLGLQETIPLWQGLLMLGLLIVLVVMQYIRDRAGVTSGSDATPPIPQPEQIPTQPLVTILLILTGLGGLLLGADLFVEGAVRTAEILGVSQGLIGLTIVAVGTSLPELATSTVASLRGQSDMAYGNILGSNLFNLLGIFGCAIIAGPITVPAIMVSVDGPVMIAATAVMLLFLATGARLNRVEAGVMLAAYVAYISTRYFYALAQ